MYDVLPLYHTSGLSIAAGQMLVNGTTLVLRKKFSASNFSDDCFNHKCTVSNFFNGRFFFMPLKCILQRNHVQAIMLIKCVGGLFFCLWQFQNANGICIA